MKHLLNTLNSTCFGLAASTRLGAAPVADVVFGAVVLFRGNVFGGLLPCRGVVVDSFLATAGAFVGDAERGVDFCDLGGLAARALACDSFSCIEITSPEGKTHSIPPPVSAPYSS